MPEVLRLAYQSATGRVVLACSRCGDQHVSEPGEPGVVVAAVTATFVTAHAACGPAEAPGTVLA